SVVLMDLDKFKNVNDTKGHLEGDLVLTRVGRLLEQKCGNRTWWHATGAMSSLFSCRKPVWSRRKFWRNVCGSGFRRTRCSPNTISRGASEWAVFRCTALPWKRDRKSTRL